MDQLLANDGTRKQKQVCLAQLGLLGASLNTEIGMGKGEEAFRGSNGVSTEGKGMPS